MSQLDEVKGYNTTLRYWIGVVVSLVVLCIGTAIGDYRAEKIDEVTALALVTALIGIALIGVMQIIVNKNNKKMRGL